EAWDYPADSLGYITGLALELYQPCWVLRYGFFQMPRVSNGTALDPHFLAAWGMVSELEARYEIAGRHGSLRFLGFFHRAHMGSYQAALEQNPMEPPDIAATRAYRTKYGFGLNFEQELTGQL